MLVRPNVLLIGAAARNVGKTELACELIRQVSSSKPVLGIKITTADGDENKCPRGGDGCGVCTTLNEPYLITREDCVEGNKDTARMFRAGAQEVLWLRVKREHIQLGIAELFRHLPSDVPIICESNSARKALIPGLFLIVRRKGDGAIKPSCAAVFEHADRVLDFHGDGWDIDPREILFTEGRWMLQPNASAIILAGGQSQRMGADKGLLDMGGAPLIQRVADQLAYFPQRLISTNDPSKYAFLDLPMVPDIVPDQGPLMGIASCLAHATKDLSFVTGCDIPLLEPSFVLDLLQKADGVDVVMPQGPDGRTEPLLAVYRKSVGPLALNLLASGTRRIVAVLEQVRVCYVPFENPTWYGNLNTREDYQMWLMKRNRGMMS